MTEPASREELLELLRHALEKAGNAILMTPELLDTLVDQSSGNYRLLMNMGGDLLKAYGNCSARSSRAARREMLPGGLSARALLAPRDQEESEGLKMSLNGDQSLPVVRVGEIKSEAEPLCRWLVEDAMGRVVCGSDRWRSQMLEDVAGAGHCPLSRHWHGVLGQVCRARAGTGFNLPG